MRNRDFNLPEDHTPFIDKYFLRAKEILEKENLNPMVKAQVFLRRGNCPVYGLDEAISILCKYSDIEKTGKIYALDEGDYISNGEVIMVIEAPIQSIIDLETMYLGVISAETTKMADGIHIDLEQVKMNMAEIVELAGDRPVAYFGARHWRYDEDADIARAAFDGGAQNCSTDVGGATVGQVGMGTIPHALETVYHWKHDAQYAVPFSTIAFDKHIDPEVKRIALVDYNNHEIVDTLGVAKVLGKKLYGVRVDTCGENMMESVMMPHLPIFFDHWFGNGVTVCGVYTLKRALLETGNDHVKIMLSSGFGKPEKVQTFVHAEALLGVQLFDGLGVGGIFESRFSTMDIIAVEGQEIHKKGRKPLPADRLKAVW